MTSKPLMEPLILDVLNISMAGSMSSSFSDDLFSMSSIIYMSENLWEAKKIMFTILRYYLRYGSTSEQLNSAYLCACTLAKPLRT